MKQTLILLVAVCLHTIGYAQTWSVDNSYSSLNFSITHLGVVEINGRFTNFEATITSSKDDFSDAVFEVKVDVTSINTDNLKRDEALRGPDYFNAPRFPTFSFVSKSFSKVTGKTYKLIGDLTWRGITKSLTLELVFNGTTIDPVNKKTKAGFQISGTIKRNDFTIAPGVPLGFLSDEVKLRANGMFVKH